VVPFTKNKEVDGNGIYPENCMQSAALHRPVGHTTHMSSKTASAAPRPPAVSPPSADRLGP